jgi:hypothetical protein
MSDVFFNNLDIQISDRARGVSVITEKSVLVEYDKNNLQPPCLMAYQVHEQPEVVTVDRVLGRELLLFEGADQPPIPQRMTVRVDPITRYKNLSNPTEMASTPPISVLAYAMPYTVLWGDWPYTPPNVRYLTAQQQSAFVNPVTFETETINRVPLAFELTEEDGENSLDYLEITLHGPGVDVGELEGVWVWTRYRFFLAIHPSWFYLLTFGLLSPRTGKTNAHLAPGFCPVFGQPGTRDARLENLYKGLKKLLPFTTADEQAGYTLAFIAKPTSGTSEGMKRAIVFRQRPTNLDITEMAYVHLEDDPFLFVSVVMSLVLAIVGAIVGSVAVWRVSKVLYIHVVHKVSRHVVIAINLVHCLPSGFAPVLPTVTSLPVPCVVSTHVYRL